MHQEEITVSQLRANTIKYQEYEVWDPARNKWVDATTSDYMYIGQTGFSSVSNPYAPISAVAIKHEWQTETICYAVPPPGMVRDRAFMEQVASRGYKLIICNNERELLLNFCKEIENSDLLSAWNGDFFDFPYIAKRLDIVFGEGKCSMMNFDLAPPPRFSERFVRGKPQVLLDMAGRITCDLLELFKKFEPAPRESYKLESIAAESLTDFDKLSYEGSLYDLYRNDFFGYCDYNVRDTDILEKLEQKYKYIRLANQLYHLSAGLFFQVKGTVKLADLAIMNYCHGLGIVAPDRYVEGEIDEGGQIEGAVVLDPQVGFHRWFGFVDVGSLYPNVFCTLNMSPETFIGQFVCSIPEPDYSAVMDNPKALKLARTNHHTAVVNEMYRQRSLIINQTSDDLTIKYSDQSEVTQSAKQWYDLFVTNNWAISGYATVFNQTTPGVVPSILNEWKVLRKKYQKLKKEAEAEKVAILARYKS